MDIRKAIGILEALCCEPCALEFLEVDAYEDCEKDCETRQAVRKAVEVMKEYESKGISKEI